MILRRLLTMTILLTSTIWSQAQQINAVPDYVFRNQMSVGRNAVTDTAAYFSIGPRYGATRGMMPPMVVDTASFSANKRNGLLIFSVQKNKFLYWDSVGVKWAEMAGTGGSAITGSGVAGYMPEFTTTTNIDTTRLYHSAGRFAIGSTTTTNAVFNVYGGESYFDTSLKVGGQTFIADESKNEVYVNTTSDAGTYALQIGGSIYNTTGANFAVTSGSVGVGTTTPASYSNAGIALYRSSGASIISTVTDDSTQGAGIYFQAYPSAGTSANIRSYGQNQADSILKYPLANSFVISTAPTRNGPLIIAQQARKPILIGNNGFVRLAINSDGETILSETGDTTDNGNFRLQVVGGIRSTTGSVFAVTSGNVGIGTASPSAKLDVNGDIFTSTRLATDLINGYFGGSTPLRIQTGGTQNLIFGTNATERMRVNTTGEIIIDATGTDAGDYKLQVVGNVYTTGSITTGAPSGGSIKPWKIGEAATVSPTSPNRTIRVEIDGVVYYLHAKTTND